VGWTRIPTTAPRTPRLGGGSIESFGDGNPAGLVRDFCSPIATGFQVETELTLVGGDCAPGVECYGAIVLSSANDMASGSKLLDEIAVQLVVPPTGAGDPELQVSRGGTVVARAGSIPTGVATPIELTVGPTLDDDGTPSIGATVAMYDEDLVRTVILDGFVVMPQRELVSDRAGCTLSPGLFVAVEGVGARVHVGPVTMTELQCTNPGLFRTPATENGPLSAALLGFGDWASGGISHPALVSTESGTGSRWDVLLDGTDVEREQETIIDIGFAIGHAYAGPSGWNTSWASLADAPRIGDCHPSCVGFPSCEAPFASMCPTRRGLREPTAYPQLFPDGTIQQLNLAYATESATAGVFGIAIDSGASPSQSMVRPDLAAALDPGDVECRSLREPSLVPANTDHTAWWLFYTCERDMMPPEIRAVQLSAAFDVLLGTDQTVLTATTFGSIASGGVRSPEVLVEFVNVGGVETAYFRLWATAIRGITRSIVLVTGESVVDAPPSLPLGDDGLRPYPENPVLTLDDIACPGDSCKLLAMSVARRADRNDTLRYLVAQAVDDASGRRYQLVPLEQTWPMP
jgi:hypothetical protein